MTWRRYGKCAEHSNTWAIRAVATPWRLYPHSTPNLVVQYVAAHEYLPPPPVMDI